jgi:hypothetical protein
MGTNYDESSAESQRTFPEIEGSPVQLPEQVIRVLVKNKRNQFLGPRLGLSDDQEFTYDYFNSGKYVESCFRVKGERPVAYFVLDVYTEFLLVTAYDMLHSPMDLDEIKEFIFYHDGTLDGDDIRFISSGIEDRHGNIHTLTIGRVIEVLESDIVNYARTLPYNKPDFATFKDPVWSYVFRLSFTENGVVKKEKVGVVNTIEFDGVTLLTNKLDEIRKRNTEVTNIIVTVGAGVDDTEYMLMSMNKL